LRLSARLLLSSAALGLATLALHAQDTRHVTEPHIPAACTTLDAALAARNGVLADAEERRLDTVRIQQAIDACAPGKAVCSQRSLPPRKDARPRPPRTRLQRAPATALAGEQHSVSDGIRITHRRRRLRVPRPERPLVPA
jgi:hypothetical protein